MHLLWQEEHCTYLFAFLCTLQTHDMIQWSKEDETQMKLTWIHFIVEDQDYQSLLGSENIHLTST